MTHEDKIAHAKHLIFEWFRQGQSAMLCSFGKDSMTLLHLCLQVLPRNPANAHSYPIPVIYHRHPYFPAKNDFADDIIRSWAIEAYSYPPGACGVKVKPDRIELVARYHFGSGAMDIPLNTEEPIPRRDYLCGLEWLLRPKITGMTFPWRTVYHGHKNSDVDPFEGPVPLKGDTTVAADVNVIFPLRHWTDDDVWQYIEDHQVNYDRRRYDDRKELADTWLNPDYINACTKCIDPREKQKTVFCPKLQSLVRNMGPHVVRLQDIPDYIERREEHAIHSQS